MYNENYLADVNRNLIDMKVWNNTQLKMFSNYYYGLSYAQLEKLTKELITVYDKVNLDINELEETYKHYAELSETHNSDVKVSINYYIYNNDVGISFPYNDEFINLLRMFGKYDKKNNGYIVNAKTADGILRKLEDLNADCSNARKGLEKTLPFIFKKIEINEREEKEKKYIEEEAVLNEITFIGKSLTNNYGYFQHAQKVFADEDMKIRKAIKEDKKRRFKENIEKIKSLFSFKR